VPCAGSGWCWQWLVLEVAGAGSGWCWQWLVLEVFGFVA